MKKLGELIEQHRIDVDEHLDRQMDIPILTGLQAQGDVVVIPRPRHDEATIPVPRDGISLVSGGVGGHTHTLLGEGEVSFEPAVYRVRLAAPKLRGLFRGVRLARAGQPYGIRSGQVLNRPLNELDIGWLTVRVGSAAYLAHPEHAYSGVGPGTYLLRRQREVGGIRSSRNSAMLEVRYIAD